MQHARGELAVDLAFQLSAGGRLPDAAPLFEEERNARAAALVANGKNPFFFHRAGAGTAFATDNDPMNSGEIDRSQVFQERLDGEKADRGVCGAEVVNSREAVLLVLDADTPPDVRCSAAKPRVEFRSCLRRSERL